MSRRTDAQRKALARDAAERVARNTGTPAQLCYAPILWALQDADYATVPPYSARRMWAEYAAILGAVLAGIALLAWCWP